MSRAGRQGPVDTQQCFYAEDPTSRPECTLTAVARYGATVLCATCQPRRSTIGKGMAAVALPTGTALDVLAWVSAAQDQAAAAQRTLTASVTRARHAGHSWTAISTRLGTTRQAAQQRFGTPTNTRGREETTRSRDKQVTAD